MLHLILPRQNHTDVITCLVEELIPDAFHSYNVTLNFLTAMEVSSLFVNLNSRKFR